MPKMHPNITPITKICSFRLLFHFFYIKFAIKYFFMSDQGSSVFSSGGCFGVFVFVAMLLIMNWCINTNTKNSNNDFACDTTIVYVDKTNYMLCINNIRDNEGCVLDVYDCPSGHPTIGYGHMLRKNDKIGHKITQSQADSMLYADFDSCIKAANDMTGFTGDKCLAIAHFIYGFGTEKFRNSKLISLIKYKNPKRSEIEKQWLSWCNYKDKNGNWIQSENLKKARLFELQLFFSNER